MIWLLIGDHPESSSGRWGEGDGAEGGGGTGADYALMNLCEDVIRATSGIGEFFFFFYRYPGWMEILCMFVFFFFFCRCIDKWIDRDVDMRMDRYSKLGLLFL